MRCQNCNRKSAKKGVDDDQPPLPKKPKLDSVFKHSYPSIEITEMDEDDETHERNLGLLVKEASKPKNTRECFQLMSRTFKKRREWILNEVHPL